MSQSRARVLIVDDDGDLRRSLGEALEEAGYDVVSSANGHDALMALKSFPLPDVILLDLLMPVMNGWQFCQAKRDVTAAAAVPVIAMSAAVSSDPGSPYFIEVQDFIAKPLELRELLGKLAACTSGSNLSTSAG